MKGQIQVISRHMEGQETSESDPPQGKLQKDLDFLHIPLYAILRVKPTYVCDKGFKSSIYKFSHVYRDGIGNIKGQKMVQGV